MARPRHIATLALTLALCAGVVHSEPLRIATWDVELTRKGPGRLLADILKPDDQVAAVVSVIEAAAPDVLLLTGFDQDYGGHALAALDERLGGRFPHRVWTLTNAGMPTGIDLDGNGRIHEARDSQGYGRFAGNGGMAVLSRLPLGEMRDFSALLWRDFPGARLPTVDGKPFPSEAAQAVQRLSSVGHWDVPVETGKGTLHLLAFSATTPVFDGPEDLNGRRNADEITFWQRYLEDALPFTSPSDPVVVIGTTNLDPDDGEGRREVMAALLADPRFQDPRPASPGGRAAATPGQRGDPGLDTADWSDPIPGNLRVDYVLPDARLIVTGAGVVWPAPGDPMAQTVEAASRHRLVWVDVEMP